MSREILKAIKNHFSEDYILTMMDSPLVDVNFCKKYYKYGENCQKCFLVAAIDKKLDAVAKRLIKKGASVNFHSDYYPGDYYCSPLHCAAYRNMEELADILINNGADIHKLDAFKQTPLFCAVNGNAYDVFVLLMNKGADIDLVNVFGWTPLFDAAQNDRKEIAALLIEKNANVNR